MNSRERFAFFCAVLGNAIFGFSFMFSRIALNTAEPFVMLTYRFITAFLLLAVIAAASSRKKEAKTTNRIEWNRFELKGKNLLPLLGMGMIQPVGYFLCESYGISMTNATFSGVIISLVPIAAIIGAAMTLKEFPSIKQVLFCILSIAGVVLMTIQQNSEGQIRPLGVLLLLGAVITGAYFNVLSRKLSNTFSALERTVVMMGIAAVTFAVLAIIQNKDNLSVLLEPLKHADFLVSVFYLSVCSSVVAFLALNLANNDLPVVRTASLANLTTVISLFAGVLFLHEPFSMISAIGSVTIIIGIYGAQKT